MRQREAELAELNIDVKVVTFDVDSMALAYVNETKLSWPLLLDSRRELYSAYGMERGTWWAIYNLVSIWRYLKLIVSGKQPGKPGRDWRQLGGDILIAPNGIVRLHYVSLTPHHRPSVETILEARHKF